MGNSIVMTGNLTREPEIRYTRDGQATALLGVAVNRRWQDRQTQQWEESTSFFDVVCWRELAENVALSLTKGMRVVVSGRLEQRSWETEEGERRSRVEVVADELGPSLRFATADVQRTSRRLSVEEQPPARPAASAGASSTATAPGAKAAQSGGASAQAAPNGKAASPAKAAPPEGAGSRGAPGVPAAAGARSAPSASATPATAQPGQGAKPEGAAA